MKYDPLQAPDPEEWLSMDEQDRIQSIQLYHEEAGEKLENATLHASAHAAIENQIAEGDSRVVSTLERLMDEGLDRHDAVHAVGSVLVEEIWRLSQESDTDQSKGTRYYEGLSRLTASSWRSDS